MDNEYSMNEINKDVYMESSDGIKFKVSLQIVYQSIVCADMLKAMENITEDITIPVANVDGKTLKRVIEFCRYYENEPLYIPPTTEDPSQPLPSKESWDMEFLDLPTDELRDIILAANYLNIPRLIDACCYKLGSEIQGKSVEDVRQIFDIKNDFSFEDEERMKREHMWYEPNVGNRENR